MAFLWIGIFLGLKAKSPEAANAMFGLLYPVTMLSSAFVATALMPGWLGAIAELEPAVVDDHRHPGAVRQPGRRGVGLGGRPRPRDGDRLAAADHRAHAPLAVRAYQRLSR